jgi:hypothetical protein
MDKRLETKGYREDFEKTMQKLADYLYEPTHSQDGEDFQRLGRFLWSLPREDFTNVVQSGYGFEDADTNPATMSFFLGMLHHAMVDDGEMEMLNVVGHGPMILFHTNRWDDEYDNIQLAIRDRKMNPLKSDTNSYSYDFLNSVEEFIAAVVDYQDKQKILKEEAQAKRLDFLTRMQKYVTEKTETNIVPKI